MKRVLFSARALWHQWRAYRLTIRAERLFQAGDAHDILARGYWLSARYMARGALPNHSEDTEPTPAGCAFAAQALLASLVGLFIAGLWIWISARAGR